MKKIIGIINALLVAAIFVGNYFYLTEGGLLLKGLCSGAFALIGLVNLCYALLKKEKDLRYPAAMAVGLVLAMLGDIFIGKNFVLGAGLFALGHVCYVIAYCFMMELRRRDLIFGGVIFLGAACFILFAPVLSFSAVYMRWVCFVYALIISMMVGKALSNVTREQTVVTIVLAVGSVLFFRSDLMLVFDWFTAAGSWTGKVCMATYYPAQCLLAVSSYLLLARKK